MSESALVLSESEWVALKRICNHYLAWTAWADDPKDVEPGEDVVARRELSRRIVAACS